MRWDLIDQFQILKKGDFSQAVKTYSGEEDFFREHFPGRPLVPDVLFVEMVAQTGGVLFGLELNFGKEIILAKIIRAQFHIAVPPPCAFTIHARMEEASEDGAFIFGVVKQGDKIVAEAHILLAAVTGLVTENGKKIVFNDHFLKHYDILNLAGQGAQSA